MELKVVHFELIPNKVVVKIYNRNFTKSSHNYLLRHGTFDEIKQNHDAIVQDLSSKSLRVLDQVHGIDVVDGNEKWDIGHEPKADGMFCSDGGVVLGIQTADCVPVLVSSIDGEVIGAVHCGWKSAVGGILSVLKVRMRQKTDEKLVAVIGPSIQQKSYEVDSEYYKNIVNKSDSYSQFFIKKNDEKYLFDLPAFVKKSLHDLDIELVKHFDEDTYSMPDVYPSYRYATHQGGKYKGSILSCITLRDDVIRLPLNPIINRRYNKQSKKRSNKHSANNHKSY